jgi:hypothetical protein
VFKIGNQWFAAGLWVLSALGGMNAKSTGSKLPE